MNKIFLVFCLTLLLPPCMAELPKQDQSFAAELKELESARLKAFKDGDLKLLYLLDGKILRRREWQRARENAQPLTEWRTAFYMDLMKENKEALKHFKELKDDDGIKAAEKNIVEVEQLGIPQLRESMIIRVSGDDGSSSPVSKSRYGSRSSSSYSNISSRHQELIQKMRSLRR